MFHITVIQDSQSRNPVSSCCQHHFSFFYHPFRLFCAVPDVLFCPVSERQAEAAGVEPPAPPAGHDGELFILAVFVANGGGRKLCHHRLPTVPSVPADLAVMCFFLLQGFNIVGADRFAWYQRALQSDHRRLAG